MDSWFYRRNSALSVCLSACNTIFSGYTHHLNKLQKPICRTVGPSLAVSLEDSAHRRNAVRLSLFYRYYFGRCSSELVQLVSLSYSRVRSARYSDRLHDFSVTIPRCCKDIYVSSFFPRTTRLWNYRMLSFDLWYKWL